MRQPEWSVARGSSTMIWRSYYTPTFIGLTCLSASSTNCVWWCADARTALRHSIWLYIGHQSLRPHHDSIFVRLMAINWQCRHIVGPHMAVGRLLSLVRRCGTYWQNVYVIPLLVPLFLAIFWKHSSSQSTSVSGALEALAMVHYININLRFTLHYIMGSPSPPLSPLPVFLPSRSCCSSFLLSSAVMSPHLPSPSISCPLISLPSAFPLIWYCCWSSTRSRIPNGCLLEDRRLGLS